MVCGGNCEERKALVSRLSLWYVVATARSEAVGVDAPDMLEPDGEGQSRRACSSWSLSSRMLQGAAQSVLFAPVATDDRRGMATVSQRSVPDCIPTSSLMIIVHL